LDLERLLSCPPTCRTCRLLLPGLKTGAGTWLTVDDGGDVDLARDTVTRFEEGEGDDRFEIVALGRALPLTAAWTERTTSASAAESTAEELFEEVSSVSCLSAESTAEALEPAKPACAASEVGIEAFLLGCRAVLVVCLPLLIVR
jgi:hypothetical protein